MVAVMDHLGTVDRPASIPEPVRTRLESPDAEQLPVLTVYQARMVANPMRDEREGRSSRGAIVRRALLINFEVLVKASPGMAADALADPILAWASNAMSTAGKLPTTGYPKGLLTDPPDEADLNFEYEQATFLFCRATLTVQCEFTTATDDVEALV